jgi:hypothetical protein
VPVGYATLEEGIQAAKDYHELNYVAETPPQYRVYKAADPDGSDYAIVEVWDGRRDRVFTGLYKVIAGKYRRPIP